MPAWLAALEIAVLLLGLYATVRLCRAGDTAWRARPPITVAITVDVSGFIDAMQKASAAMQRLEPAFRQMSAAMTVTAPQLQRLAWRLRRDLRAILDPRQQ